jgi:hypothetical protein
MAVYLSKFSSNQTFANFLLGWLNEKSNQKASRIKKMESVYHKTIKYALTVSVNDTRSYLAEFTKLSFNFSVQIDSL